MDAALDAGVRAHRVGARTPVRCEPELIITVIALKAGLHAMVAASLIGAILFNLLLVTGLSFLLGGLRRHTLEFNAQAIPLAVASS